MTIDSVIRTTSTTRFQRILLLTASVITYLLVTMGGIVCATRSTLGCPDWPGCFGQFIPPLQSNAIIEYTHRFIAALTTPLIITAAIVGWRRSRPMKWISRPPVIAVAFTFAVIVFGAFAVLTGLPPALAAVDLGSALIVLALMVIATVSAFAQRDNPMLADSLSFRKPFARLVLWTAGAVFFVLVSAVLVAESGSLVRCLGWPLYDEPLLLDGLRGWLLLARRLVAGAAAILIFAIVIQAWRTQRGQAGIVRVATLVGVLFLVEAISGILIRTSGFAPYLLVPYVAAAAGLWALLVVLVMQAGLATSP
jgi:cytochrome c oxidase assembly protein subunit 15